MSRGGGGAAGLQRGEVQHSARGGELGELLVDRRHPDVGSSGPRCVPLDQHPDHRDGPATAAAATRMRPCVARAFRAGHGTRTETGQQAHAEEPDHPTPFPSPATPPIPARTRRGAGRARSGAGPSDPPRWRARRPRAPTRRRRSRPVARDRAQPHADQPHWRQHEEHDPRERRLAVDRPPRALAEQRAPEREARVGAAEVGAQCREVGERAAEAGLLVAHLEVGHRHHQRAQPCHRHGPERPRPAAPPERTPPHREHDQGGAERDAPG